MFNFCSLRQDREGINSDHRVSSRLDTDEEHAYFSSLSDDHESCEDETSNHINNNINHATPWTDEMPTPKLCQPNKSWRPNGNFKVKDASLESFFNYFWSDRPHLASSGDEIVSFFLLFGFLIILNLCYSIIIFSRHGFYFLFVDGVLFLTFFIFLNIIRNLNEGIQTTMIVQEKEWTQNGQSIYSLGGYIFSELEFEI